MRWLRRIAVVLLAAVALATVLTWHRGDPKLYPPAPGEPSLGIEVVSNGFHSGLALPRAALAEASRRLGLGALHSVAERFGAFAVVEIGWGEARFYRSTPTLGSIDPWLALSALFRPGNESVLHVVGLPDRAAKVYAANIVPISVTPAGFDAIANRIDRALARGGSGQAVPLGAGLVRDSLFYVGVETFNAFRVCNHWTSDVLSEAGVPTVTAWATLPDGLLFDLRWHAGLPALPRTPD